MKPNGMSGPKTGQFEPKSKPRELKGIVMLVLTRKRSEMIQIGDDIRIKVIRTASGHVKLGIEAPDHAAQASQVE